MRHCHTWYAWSCIPYTYLVHESVPPPLGKRAVSVSASKYRTAVVSELGQVYCWESQRDLIQLARKAGLQPPAPAPALPSSLTTASSLSAPAPEKNTGASTCVVPERVSGIRRASSVAVGEKHSMVLVSLALPALPDSRGKVPSPVKARGHMRHLEGMEGEEEMDSVSDDGDVEDRDGSPLGVLVSSHLAHAPATALGLEYVAEGEGDEEAPLGVLGTAGLPSPVPSLQSICQLSVARQLVEPRCELLTSG